MHDTLLIRYYYLLLKCTYLLNNKIQNVYPITLHCIYICIIETTVFNFSN